MTLNNFTYSIPPLSQENLVFGNKTQMDVYEAYIINRAITDYEMDMLITRILWKHEIKYKPLRAYLPTGTSDVATKYYADNLSFFKSPAPSLLNMNNFRITNLLNPTNANDATNMTWVNSQGFLKSPLVANLDAGAKIITNLAAPVSVNDATNMTWVNSQGFLKSPLVANLDVGAKFITNLATPIALSDAANKSYVDNRAKNYQLLSGAVSFNSTSYNSSITHVFTLYNTTGNIGNYGYYWPADGRVLRLGYNICSTLTGYTLTGIVGLIKNTTGVTESLHTIPSNTQKGLKIYSPAISFVTGDTLSFSIVNLGIQAPTTLSAVITLFVHALIEYDII